MQSEPRGITAALLCLHMKSETAGRGREGVSVSIRCVQITRYVWRAWCAATIQITHPHCHSSMQMACKSAEREKRRREKRGWQLTHSLHCTSSWHTPPPHHLSSPLFPLLISRPHPQHTHSPSPPLIWLTTTTHHGCSHSTCLSSHTHVPSLTQCMCQCTEVAQQQQPDYSLSSPPPAAQVLLPLHATHVNTSSKWYMCE